MRLVCPNCSAQYEIDGSMIPPEGRDVQCSNCGHTWFELRGPEADLDAPEPQTEFTAPPVEDDSDDFDDIPTSRRETRPAQISRQVFEEDDDVTPDHEEDQDEPDDDAGDAKEADRTSEAIRALAAAAESDDAQPEDDEEEEEEDEPEDVALAPKPRRPADAAALDILREEAEREMSRRRAPPSEPIETQPDLGLHDISRRRTPSRALRARMAHLGEDAPEDDDRDDSRDRPDPRQAEESEVAYEEPRRDLLPDIEEINSTLKSSRGGKQADEARHRSGFRAGFMVMLLASLALVFAYAQAPAIARALPEAEPAMIGFVDLANQLRDWIDGLIGG